MSVPRAAVTVGIPTYNRAASLRDTIASVLSQSYRDFRLLVSDNASDDETPDVVASFADPRIEYLPSARNIGMIGNFNRLIHHAETPFLVLLPDDDLLYPDHLRCVVDVLERYPSVGVVHTAYDLVDSDSTVLSRGANLLGTAQALTIESTHDFLERALCSNPIVSFPSAIYRTEAIKDAEGLREEEEPFSDVPMWMRIALNWDFAFLSRPLVAFRVHEDTATASLGSFDGTGYVVPVHRILRDRRRGFLDEAASRLPDDSLMRYRSLVERTFRADEILRLANHAGLDTPWMSTTTSLVQLAREDPRVLGVPRMWQLVAAHVGGRQARRAISRLNPRRSAARRT
jgi:hypothetical protein